MSKIVRSTSNFDRAWSATFPLHDQESPHPAVPDLGRDTHDKFTRSWWENWRYDERSLMQCALQKKR